ncbi:MAG: hypothetical protein PHO79_04250 [Desulfoplanes sp.]|nr:hypothetical protein [Desulfoplanes sp.]
MEHKRTDPAQIKKISLQNISNILASFFLLINFLILLVPLYPGMPRGGLDPSWVLGMVHATAEHLIIGHDIIFTFGPFSSIYTKVFHPDTDIMTLTCSTYLAFMYWIATLCILRGKSPWWWWVLGGSLVCIPLSKDSILLLYPVIIALILISYNFHPTRNKLVNTFFTPFLIIILFFPLGLLILIKVTLLPVCLFALLVVCFKFLKENYWAWIIASVASVLISLICFWTISGQPAFALLEYFGGLLPIISGYTEAMSSSGPILEIISYLMAAMSILLAILLLGKNNQNKFYICFIFFIYLFIGFKQGFVRHDGHAMAAGSSIFLSMILLGMFIDSKHYMFVILLSVLSWGIIDSHYVGTSTKNIFLSHKYQNALNELQIRIKNYDIFNEKYTNAMISLRKKGNLPLLKGTSDIYSYQQSYLIASGNRWSPRPIFQSYSAYTKTLEQKNLDHLLSKNSPDNIFFNVQTIDGRLPSLDDGRSWPALLSEYTPITFDRSFLRLKKILPDQKFALEKISSATVKMGDNVSVPYNRNPIFAEIKIKPTILGKFLSLLFKPSQLEIELNLNNGALKKYRIISGMAEAGFIISPFIASTRDFVALYSSTNIQYDQQVSAIRIYPKNFSWVWNKYYDITFSSTKNTVKKDISSLLGLSHIENNFPEMDIVPSSGEGYIDTINAARPNQNTITVHNLLYVQGWLADSIQNGTIPEQTFITLQNNAGNIFYAKTKKHPRPDVAKYFKKSSLADAGFTIKLALPKTMTGQYRLGLAYVKKGKLHICSQFNLPITIVSERIHDKK